MDSEEDECDSGNGGNNDKRDVKQGKVLILYNKLVEINTGYLFKVVPVIQ